MFNKGIVRRLFDVNRICQDGNKFLSGSVGLVLDEQGTTELLTVLASMGRSVEQHEINGPFVDKGIPVDREALTWQFAKGATTNDPRHPVLACVFIDKQHMVSADGYRLCVSNSGAEKELLAGPQVGAFLKAAPKGELTCYNTEDVYYWQAGGWTLQLVMDEGLKYPDYNVIIPPVTKPYVWDKSITSIKLPKKDVSDAVVQLGNDWPLGTTTYVAPLFLGDVLKFVGDEVVTVSSRDKYAPVLFQGTKRQAVVMPVSFCDSPVWRKDETIPGLYWK